MLRHPLAGLQVSRWERLGSSPSTMKQIRLNVNKQCYDAMSLLHYERNIIYIYIYHYTDWASWEQWDSFTKCGPSSQMRSQAQISMSSKKQALCGWIGVQVDCLHLSTKQFSERLATFAGLVGPLEVSLQCFALQTNQGTSNWLRITLIYKWTSPS